MPEGALASTKPAVFWLDTADRPDARPPLQGDVRCDLVVVGGGYSGLWTALLAKERDPGREVVLLESERIGWAASGRNGGFCDANLTHGEGNGRARWPLEYDEIQRQGVANLDAIEATIKRYDIDCHFERTGEIDIAIAPHQIEGLREVEGIFLDQDAVRAEVNSPTYLAGSLRPDSVAILDPARLAWGLARAAESLGVRIVEGTRALGLERDGTGVAVRTEHGVVRAGQAALGTNAFPSLLRRLRLHTVPVYDYVLMTEPLSDAQMDSIGWRGRQGLADCANQFHYYRLTHDNRILWGGYDPIYHYGRRIRPEYDQLPRMFSLLASQFFDTFPQLEGLGFSHSWGGAVDTCTRFCAFFGTAYSGRVAYALGYTGLGVGATRFGAQVMLDHLSGETTERTELEMVRTRPFPFPPEPLASAGIQATRWSIAQADRHAGQRNLWLRSLDRVGLGFEA
ncbi:MAG: FAD-dependent oxidoreductase [Marmoricola sp.]